MQHDDNKSFLCRAFVPDEWQLCRDIRLEALLEEPSVFSSQYSLEEHKDEAYWRATASSDHCTMFAVFYEGAVVGCVGIATMRDDVSGSSAILWGTYIKKQFRSNGLSRLLYKVLIDFALTKKHWQKIHVSHRATNLTSKKATLAHGFKYVRSKTKIWHDGIQEDELCYELDLNAIRRSRK
ncbi:MAG: GNAT family N-acetyltransferase [Proteobacteria bacterium]|nr:GNAT family N-acetyltransferase [Pseudomonadota bacterium]